ncbi:MAG: caspase family protein [Sphaerochaetaceae bacterium]
MMSKKATLGVLFTFLIIISMVSCELVTSPLREQKSVKGLFIALDYKSMPSHLHLEGTIRDAKEFDQALKKLSDLFHQKYDSTLLLQEGSNQSLNDFLPKKEHILTTIESEIESLTESELLVIYYAGHGEDPNIGNNYQGGALVVADEDDPSKYDLLTQKELLEVLYTIEKGHILLILDSCFSGSYVQDYPFGVFDFPYHPKITTLSASRTDEPSYENSDSTHGLFTYYLLEALGWDHTQGEELFGGEILTQTQGAIRSKKAIPTYQGGVVTLDRIYSYVTTKLASSYLNQHPVVVSGPQSILLYSDWR